MDITTYLRRINYSGTLAPNAETLRGLQKAHLLAVPFENLSIHAGEPIILNDAALFEKIVSRHRGGFCYELNGLFAWLLRQLGFRVDMLSAGVANPKGEWGPEFDHMTLLVHLEERWLADVGFGDSFVEPLLFDNRGEQIQGLRSYRIAEDASHFVLLQKQLNEDWKPQYRFTTAAHAYSDYDEMCRYQQTSLESHFTKGRVCSRLTPDGRVTLSQNRLILTKGSDKEEREVNQNEVVKALREYFDIVM